MNRFLFSKGLIINDSDCNICDMFHADDIKESPFGHGECVYGNYTSQWPLLTDSHYVESLSY